jgi:hypothetical protein
LQIPGGSAFWKECQFRYAPEVVNHLNEPAADSKQPRIPKFCSIHIMTLWRSDHRNTIDQRLTDTASPPRSITEMWTTFTPKVWESA